MSNFQKRLIGIREKTREQITQLLEQNIGQAGVVHYDRDSWSALISGAIFLCVRTDKLAEAVGVDVDVVDGWLNGSLPDSRTNQQQRAVQYIANRLLPESR